MIRIILLALCSLLSTCAAAQYPSRPVTLLIGYPAGGLVDIVARLVAEGMRPRFPHGIVVVTRPGAAGSVAIGELTRAAADGYTFVLTPASALVIAPQLNELPYRTPDDYDPFINLVAYYPLIGVRAESKYKSIQELLTDAKDNPGQIRVGSPGEGTSSHISLEELSYHAGVKVVHVPYAGWAQSGVAVLGGHIEAVVAQSGELKPMLEGRRMRALLNFTPRRHPAFPEVPTAKELGWDVSNGIWYLMLAPKGTPAPVVRHLHDAAKAAIEEPRFAEAMASRAIDVDYRPGEALRADLWREYRSHTEILKRIGLLKR